MWRIKNAFQDVIQNPFSLNQVAAMTWNKTEVMWCQFQGSVDKKLAASLFASWNTLCGPLPASSSPLGGWFGESYLKIER